MYYTFGILSEQSDPRLDRKVKEMTLRLEISRKWFEKNAEDMTQMYLRLYPNEESLVKTHYILEFKNNIANFHFVDYDGQEKIDLSNYDEDDEMPVYVSVDIKPTPEEWSMLGFKLVKMYNKLKNIIESI